MHSQKLLDQFAMSALNALITKSPFFDVKGEYGNKITPEELQEIKKGLTATAYEYAEWMLIAREESKKWLKESESTVPGFGL